MAIVPVANQEKVPFVGPWAAGTAITKNGANPNFAFRVSAVDEIVNVGMLDYAQKTFKGSKFGLILVNNPWGESNEKGLNAALAAKGMRPVGVEKFEGNDVDVVPQLTRLKAAGADTLFMVGNVGPSAQVVKSLDRMGWQVPIATGAPPAVASPSWPAPTAERAFVQTYSFFQAVAGGREGDRRPEGIPPSGADDITPAVGVLTPRRHDVAALAIPPPVPPTVTPAPDFYKITSYGLIKTLRKPFTPAVHDAVASSDYVWAQFIDNRILPVGMAK
jgi:branched-chain amino acid transport system substrate-binding protein